MNNTEHDEVVFLNSRVEKKVNEAPATKKFRSERTLYTINRRPVYLSTAISVTSYRGSEKAVSSEKVLPYVIEYDIDGNFELRDAEDIIQGVPKHPYKANSPQYSEERIADVEVSNLLQHLEHYPYLPTAIYEGETKSPHKIGEIVYGNMVYIKPTPEADEELKKLNFLEAGNKLAEIVGILKSNLQRDLDLVLDVHSVPKKKVGTFFYTCLEDNIGVAPLTLSLGFHKAIPRDRIAREIGSLKSCEIFKNRVNPTLEIPEELEEHVSFIRVAIAALDKSMLDSGDLYPSSIPKLACEMKHILTVEDISRVDPEALNLKYKVHRSGIQVVHEEVVSIDEEKDYFSSLKLVFTGGLKVAAQLQTDSQLLSSTGDPIDLLLDFRSVAAKGAVHIFGMMFPDLLPKNPTREDCIKLFKKLQPESVYIGLKEYRAYVGYLPVFRTRNRYLEQNVPSHRNSSDLIAKAILKRPYIVSKKNEFKYQQLRKLREDLKDILEDL